NRVETVDFRGAVESIDGLNWQVGSLALTITPATSRDDRVIVGDRVDVVAYTTPSSQLVAQVIDLVERNQELPPPSATPQATLTVTVTASPTETASPSETATATPSPDPTSTGTPSPTTTVTST